MIADAASMAGVLNIPGATLPHLHPPSTYLWLLLFVKINLEKRATLGCFFPCTLSVA
jgi:hypothetical protein